MKTLRKAREMAMQILFQKGFQEGTSAQDLFNSFADNFEFDQTTKDYSLFLTKGVLENESQIDEMISSLSQNWKIDRIAKIDKILIQLAIFELTISDQTPTAPKLCITDIIDLSKKYSSSESKNFINGIIDQVYHNHKQ